MLSFWKKKNLISSPVQFSSLVNDGANFVIVFGEDTYQNYEILQYCSSWNDRFKQFNFFLPIYSHGFFSRIDSFSNAVFHEINTGIRLFDNSIILNLSSDQNIRKKLSDYPASLIIDGTNEGNLQFVPKIKGEKELFLSFVRFFNLKLEKSQLHFNFTSRDFGSTNFKFFQNKFLNFLLDSNRISLETLKDIIISIKQNFPSNIYLCGQILKKHEFINLKNLAKLTLLEKYLFAGNSDLLISDDYETVRIFRDLEMKQLYISDDQPLDSVPMDSVPTLNSTSIHIIKEAISSILEK
jgi:hypothetical protein